MLYTFVFVSYIAILNFKVHYMKAKIESVSFKKEYEGQHGTLYNFEVGYNGRVGFYSSKSKDQNKFIAGQEAEFTEQEREGKNGSKYYIIKPVNNFQQFRSAGGKAIGREQSKYAGFALSYSKDMVIADKIPIEKMLSYGKKFFDWMVEQDKTLLNG